VLQGWWARGTLLAVAVLVAAAPAQAASKAHKPHEPRHAVVRVHQISYGTVIPAGMATRVTVSPRHRLRVLVPHVGTLVIPRGAIARRTVFTLRPARALLTGGIQAAALGLDLKVNHARLRKPLSWTQNVGAQPNGSVAVFLIAPTAAAGASSTRSFRTAA
jgi:hypothetical protein